MTWGAQRTVSIGFDDRGQTTQDFVIGIGVFIIATAFVFTTVPNVIDVTTGPVDSGDVAQADRVAAAILANESIRTDRPNEIDGGAFNETFLRGGVDDATLGLRATDDRRVDRVNVTIERLNRTDVSVAPPLNLSSGESLAAGESYDGQSAVTATRIVTVTDIEGGYEDVPVRLVVRVW